MPLSTQNYFINSLDYLLPVFPCPKFQCLYVYILSCSLRTWHTVSRDKYLLNKEWTGWSTSSIVKSLMHRRENRSIPYSENAESLLHLKVLFVCEHNVSFLYISIPLPKHEKKKKPERNLGQKGLLHWSSMTVSSGIWINWKVIHFSILKLCPKFKKAEEGRQLY